MSYPVTPVPRAAGSEDSKTRALLKSESEGAYVKVRPLATKAINRFKLNYKSITKTEFATLETFFDANIGKTFSFTHPDTAVVYTCTFDQEELKKTHTDGVLVSTDITLVEQ